MYTSYSLHFIFQLIIIWRLKELGQYRQAIEIFNTTILYKPDLAVAYYAKGISLCELGQHQKEIKHYGTAIQYNPNDADFYIGKGISLYELGQHQEAIDLFRNWLR
ncbi:TPR repeat-containing protein 08 [Orientia tsutsugamushi]|uniref:TPR repeat-containing protein 08 n=1 Tax=Orientia tsutsugamushi TaxID=784 RepID=A0A2U3R6U5_ORITS|nr:tetratricopeptide repeat protein [Orientia tsutsugamushi]SPR08900.1 TPR repeat-containing protein 08 [Orientia tsutsugamushi]